MASTRTREIALYILPDFTPTEVSSALDVFRITNQICGQSIYNWQFVSDTDRLVASCEDLFVKTTGFSEIGCSPDIVILFGGESCAAHSSALLSVARWSKSFGAQLIVLSDAVSVLADLGFFGNKTVSTHWDAPETEDECLYGTTFSRSIFNEEGRTITSCGYVATFDVITNVISEHVGKTVSTKVSEYLVANGVRTADSRQRASLVDRIGTYNVKLLAAIELMEDNLEEVILIGEMADIVGTSQRQLERLFQRHFAQSPSNYYKNLRIEKAKKMVQSTSLSISDISFRSGFNSAAEFSKSYKRKYGVSPSHERVLRGAMPPMSAMTGCIASLKIVTNGSSGPILLKNSEI